MELGDENCSKLFYQDVREKKRVAIGIHHRASRKGYIRGGVKTQSDYLTTKQKRLLNGEVKVSNVYDKIENLPSWEELKIMKDEDKANILKIAKSKHTGAKLQKHWGISAGTLYGQYAKYNLYEPKSQTMKEKVKKIKEEVFSSISELPSMEEFNSYSDNKKKGILISAKQQFGAAALMRYWNLTQSAMYKLFYKYEVIQKESKSKNKEIIHKEVELDKINKSEIQEEIALSEDEKDNSKIIINKLQEKVQILTDKISKIEEHKKSGFKIEFNGEYPKEELENRLLSIAQITSENKKYRINVLLEEI